MRWLYIALVLLCNRCNAFIPAAARCSTILSLHAQSTAAGAAAAAQVVTLKKPLGIVFEEVVPNEAKGIRVKEVVDGGSAALLDSGVLVPGMALLNIFGNDCTAMTFASIMDILIAAPADKPLTLEFKPLPQEAAAAAVQVTEAYPLTGDCELKVVLPKGAPVTLVGPAGSNLRAALLASKVPVYDMVGTMTNCNGGGQCGTCVVKVSTTLHEQSRCSHVYVRSKVGLQQLMYLYYADNCLT
jgi:ferredoxin